MRTGTLSPQAAAKIGRPHLAGRTVMYDGRATETEHTTTLAPPKLSTSRIRFDHDGLYEGDEKRATVERTTLVHNATGQVYYDGKLIADTLPLAWNGIRAVSWR